MAGNAAGAIKTAATRIGITVQEYEAHRASGLKWCMKCSAWRPVANFAKDRSRGDGLKSTCSTHYARSTQGPTKLERRQRAALGQRWCRGCAAWLAAEAVPRQGVCRPCAAAKARARYAGPGGAEIRARVYARKRGLAPIPVWWAEEERDGFGGLCAYGCERSGTTWDHIWPVSRGGISAPGNLAPACGSCNRGTGGPDMRAYRCWHCGQTHLGHPAGHATYLRNTPTGPIPLQEYVQ